MFRHVVCLTLRDDTPSEAVDEIVDALRALPPKIETIRSYSVGRDAGLAEGNAHVAIVADFDDAAGWRQYQEHPDHQRVIHELVAPYKSARSGAQFEC